MSALLTRQPELLRKLPDYAQEPFYEACLKDQVIGPLSGSLERHPHMDRLQQAQEGIAERQNAQEKTRLLEKEEMITRLSLLRKPLNDKLPLLEGKVFDALFSAQRDACSEKEFDLLEAYLRRSDEGVVDWEQKLQQIRTFFAEDNSLQRSFHNARGDILDSKQCKTRLTAASLELCAKILNTSKTTLLLSYGPRRKNLEGILETLKLLTPEAREQLPEALRKLIDNGDPLDPQAIVKQVLHQFAEELRERVKGKELPPTTPLKGLVTDHTRCFHPAWMHVLPEMITTYLNDCLTGGVIGSLGKIAPNPITSEVLQWIADQGESLLQAHTYPELIKKIELQIHQILKESLSHALESLNDHFLELGRDMQSALPPMLLETLGIEAVMSNGPLWLEFQRKGNSYDLAVFTLGSALVLHPIHKGSGTHYAVRRYTGISPDKITPKFVHSLLARHLEPLWNPAANCKVTDIYNGPLLFLGAEVAANAPQDPHDVENRSSTHWEMAQILLLKNSAGGINPSFEMRWNTLIHLCKAHLTPEGVLRFPPEGAPQQIVQATQFLAREVRQLKKTNRYQQHLPEYEATLEEIQRALQILKSQQGKAQIQALFSGENLFLSRYLSKLGVTIEHLEGWSSTLREVLGEEVGDLADFFVEHLRLPAAKTEIKSAFPLPDWTRQTLGDTYYQLLRQSLEIALTLAGITKGGRLRLMSIPAALWVLPRLLPAPLQSWYYEIAGALLHGLASLLLQGFWKIYAGTVKGQALKEAFDDWKKQVTTFKESLQGQGKLNFALKPLEPIRHLESIQNPPEPPSVELKNSPRFKRAPSPRENLEALKAWVQNVDCAQGTKLELHLLQTEVLCLPIGTYWESCSDPDEAFELAFGLMAPLMDLYQSASGESTTGKAQHIASIYTVMAILQKLALSENFLSRQNKPTYTHFAVQKLQESLKKTPLGAYPLALWYNQLGSCIEDPELVERFQALLSFFLPNLDVNNLPPQKELQLKFQKSFFYWEGGLDPLHVDGGLAKSPAQRAYLLELTRRPLFLRDAAFLSEEDKVQRLFYQGLDLSNMHARRYGVYNSLRLATWICQAAISHKQVQGPIYSALHPSQHTFQAAEGTHAHASELLAALKWIPSFATFGDTDLPLEYKPHSQTTLVVCSIRENPSDKIFHKHKGQFTRPQAVPEGTRSQALIRKELINAERSEAIVLLLAYFKSYLEELVPQQPNPSWEQNIHFFKVIFFRPGALKIYLESSAHAGYQLEEFFQELLAQSHYASEIIQSVLLDLAQRAQKYCAYYQKEFKVHSPNTNARAIIDSGVQPLPETLEKVPKERFKESLWPLSRFISMDQIEVYTRPGGNEISWLRMPPFELEFEGMQSVAFPGYTLSTTQFDPHLKAFASYLILEKGNCRKVLIPSNQWAVALAWRAIRGAGPFAETLIRFVGTSALAPDYKLIEEEPYFAFDLMVSTPERAHALLDSKSPQACIYLLTLYLFQGNQKAAEEMCQEVESLCRSEQLPGSIWQVVLPLALAYTQREDFNYFRMRIISAISQSHQTKGVKAGGNPYGHDALSLPILALILLDLRALLTQNNPRRKLTAEREYALYKGAIGRIQILLHNNLKIPKQIAQLLDTVGWDLIIEEMGLFPGLAERFRELKKRVEPPAPLFLKLVRTALAIYKAPAAAPLKDISLAHNVLEPALFDEQGGLLQKMTELLSYTRDNRLIDFYALQLEDLHRVAEPSIEKKPPLDPLELTRDTFKQNFITYYAIARNETFYSIQGEPREKLAEILLLYKGGWDKQTQVLVNLLIAVMAYPSFFPKVALLQAAHKKGVVDPLSANSDMKERYDLWYAFFTEVNEVALPGSVMEKIVEPYLRYFLFKGGSWYYLNQVRERMMSVIPGGALVVDYAKAVVSGGVKDLTGAALMSRARSLWRHQGIPGETFLAPHAWNPNFLFGLLAGAYGCYVTGWATNQIASLAVGCLPTLLQTAATTQLVASGSFTVLSTMGFKYGLAKLLGLQIGLRDLVPNASIWVPVLQGITKAFNAASIHAEQETQRTQSQKKSKLKIPTSYAILKEVDDCFDAFLQHIFQALFTSTNDLKLGTHVRVDGKNYKIAAEQDHRALYLHLRAFSNSVETILTKEQAALVALFNAPHLSKVNLHHLYEIAEKEDLETLKLDNALLPDLKIALARLDLMQARLEQVQHALALLEKGKIDQDLASALRCRTFFSFTKTPERLFAQYVHFQKGREPLFKDPINNPLFNAAQLSNGQKLVLIQHPQEASSASIIAFSREFKASFQKEVHTLQLHRSQKFDLPRLHALLVLFHGAVDNRELIQWKPEDALTLQLLFLERLYLFSQAQQTNSIEQEMLRAFKKLGGLLNQLGVSLHLQAEKCHRVQFPLGAAKGLPWKHYQVIETFMEAVIHTGMPCFNPIEYQVKHKKELAVVLSGHALLNLPQKFREDCAFILGTSQEIYPVWLTNDPLLFAQIALLKGVLQELFPRALQEEHIQVDTLKHPYERLVRTFVKFMKQGLSLEQAEQLGDILREFDNPLQQIDSASLKNNPLAPLYYVRYCAQHEITYWSEGLELSAHPTDLQKSVLAKLLAVEDGNFTEMVRLFKESQALFTTHLEENPITLFIENKNSERWGIQQSIQLPFQRTSPKKILNPWIWPRMQSPISLDWLKFSSPESHSPSTQSAFNSEICPFFQVKTLLQTTLDRNLAAIAEAFSPRLWMSNNFVERVVRTPLETFSEIGSLGQFDLLEVLVHARENGEGVLEILHVGPLLLQEAADWRKRLGSFKDSWATAPVKVFLWNVKSHTVQAGFTQDLHKIRAHADFKLLIGQLKFLNGDVNYGKQQTEMEVWLRANDPQKMEIAFRSLHATRGQKTYLSSSLHRIFIRAKFS